MKKREELYELVVATAEVCGHEMTVPAAKMIARDLGAYPAGMVAGALEKCRAQVSGRLTLALILQRIDDGHLGVEEAWALCPRSEEDTVVWTDEISQAWGAAGPLADDPVAARMAFKESYARLLSAARAERRLAHWWVSLGTRTTRCPEIKRAVELGRMTAGDALRLVDDSLPGYAALATACGHPAKALPAPKREEPKEAPLADDIAAVLAKLKGGAP